MLPRSYTHFLSACECVLHAMCRATPSAARALAVLHGGACGHASVFPQVKGRALDSSSGVSTRSRVAATGGAKHSEVSAGIKILMVLADQLADLQARPARTPSPLRRPGALLGASPRSLQNFRVISEQTKPLYVIAFLLLPHVQEADAPGRRTLLGLDPTLYYNDSDDDYDDGKDAAEDVDADGLHVRTHGTCETLGRAAACLIAVGYSDCKHALSDAPATHAGARRRYVTGPARTIGCGSSERWC
eukprot:366260-Chlamydomonas_euryale.AAC.17